VVLARGSARLTSKQSERCEDYEHPELSAGKLPGEPLKSLLVFKTKFFDNFTVTTRPNRVDLSRKNGSDRNDSERFFRSIYSG